MPRLQSVGLLYVIMYNSEAKQKNCQFNVALQRVCVFNRVRSQKHKMPHSGFKPLGGDEFVQYIHTVQKNPLIIASRYISADAGSLVAVYSVTCQKLDHFRGCCVVRYLLHQDLKQLVSPVLLYECGPLVYLE